MMSAAPELMHLGRSLKPLIDQVPEVLQATGMAVQAASTLADEMDLSRMPSAVDDATMMPSELEALAAWDEWAETDAASMRYAIDQNVEGADDYLVEIRKHAIEGKLAMQAQAQAIRAGQEYLRLKAQLLVARADCDRLAKLKEQYSGEAADAENARAGFYDSLIGMRTSVVVELRKAVWAYKYLALADSNVRLDPMMELDHLQEQAHTIVQEVENWNESYSSDLSSESIIVHSS